MDSTKTTKITQSQKRSKPNDSDSENDNENDNGTWPRYLIIEPVHEGELAKLSPFAVSKGINGIAGEPKSLKRLRSGTYLVEVTRKSHADNLLRSKLLATVPIKVSPHRSLNSKKGVIWCRELDTVSLTEINQELASQQVTEVKRISVTRAGKKENTHTYILTFGMPDLPTKIKVGYLSVPVKSYIPNPLRCFRCQRFGHHRDKCKSPEVCEKCGNTDHSKESCEVDPACVNCKGKHEASSKNCPSWKREKEISRIKTEKNLPYPQARKVYESLTTAVPEKSFAEAVTQGAPKKFTSVGVQTDSSSKDEGKVLAPSKKTQTQTAKASSPQRQKKTSLTKTTLTKETLGEVKSLSQKAVTKKQTNNNHQNKNDKGPTPGNPFTALSVEPDGESDMDTENSSAGLESRSRSISPKNTHKGGSKRRSGSRKKKPS